MEVHEHGFLLLAVWISRILQGILCLSMSALSPLLSGSDTGLNLGEEPVLMLEEPKWGIDVPSCRIQGHSPTFGSLILFFFRKSTTRSYYLMHFSQLSMLGAEIWHIWKQHLRHPNWRLTVEQLLDSRCENRLFEVGWPCIFNDQGLIWGRE